MLPRYNGNYYKYYYLDVLCILFEKKLSELGKHYKTLHNNIYKTFFIFKNSSIMNVKKSLKCLDLFVIMYLLLLLFVVLIVKSAETAVVLV